MIMVVIVILRVLILADFNNSLSANNYEELVTKKIARVRWSDLDKEAS